VAEGANRAQSMRTRALVLYRVALIAPALAWLGVELARSPAALAPSMLGSMLQWVALLAVVELVATEPWGGPGLSVAFGAQVAVAMLYDPGAAGLIAFAGAFDPREPRLRMRPLHALWRRSLAGVATTAGSASFHAIAGGVDDRMGRLLPAFVVAATLMYFALLGAELLDRMLASGRPARELLQDMDRVSPYRFPMTFPGLGWFSLPAARLAEAEGLWTAFMVFALTAYGRWVCIKAWTLKARLQERNVLLDAQARELAVHLEREQRSVAELEELNRIKGQFVAMASHEVRTPLTSIIGYGNALRRMPASAGPAKRDEFLDIIERQAKRLLNLVERLLTASKLESGKLVTTSGTVRVSELCREVVEGLGAEAGRIEVDVPGDLPDAVTDRRYLSQVLGNLVENALKYSPSDQPCTLGARCEGERLVLWVHDHGVGIPQAELRHIFDRFYQVDRTGTPQPGGVGLGLALVRELVEALGGSIAVESRVGQGSRFTVTLPLRHPAAVVGPARRTTNGPRTNVPTGSKQPNRRPETSPVRRRSSNL
jgi:signal transduction histidine kinase